MDQIEQKRRLLDRMNRVLRKHFNGHVIIGEVDLADGENGTLTMHNYSGGFNRALGLVHRAKVRLERSAINSDFDLIDPPDEDENEAWKA